MGEEQIGAQERVETSQDQMHFGARNLWPCHLSINFHDTQMSLTSFLEPCYRNWWSSPKVGRSALYLEVSISDDSCFCVKGCHVALPTRERERERERERKRYIYIRIHLVGYI